MKKPLKEALGDFLVGRGFYIVLFLCVAAVGVSGWYLTRQLTYPVTVDEPVQVALPTRSPVPTPAAPRLTPTPKPTPTPVPTPETTTAPVQTPAALWGSEVYTWPVKGQVIGDFSLEVLAYDDTMGDWRVHEGLDIAAQVGTAVKVINAGTVSAVYQDDLMGTVVTVTHADGLESLYANLTAQPTVEAGDLLDTGAVLGAVGETALAEVSKPSHLHVELKKDGVSVDPVTYLPPQ